MDFRHNKLRNSLDKKKFLRKIRKDKSFFFEKTKEGDIIKDIMLTYHLKDLDRSNTKIAVHLQNWDNCKAFPKHKHDYIEVIYAVHGNGVNMIDHFSYPVIAGDLYIIKPGSLHSFYSYSKLTVYNLIFSLSLFSSGELRQLSECDNFKSIFTHSPDEAKYNKIRLSPVQNSMIGAYFAQLYQELNQREKGYRLLSKSIMVMLLTKICRISAETGKNKVLLDTSDNDVNSLSRILDYINRNYLTEITRGKIASVGNLSKNYVSEFFHKHTGTPLLKYINTLRIENAKNLLISRLDLNMGEIASCSGFADTSYFTRLFHSMCGCSPTAFRKMSGDFLKS